MHYKKASFWGCQPKTISWLALAKNHWTIEYITRASVFATTTFIIASSEQAAMAMVFSSMIVMMAHMMKHIINKLFKTIICGFRAHTVQHHSNQIFLTWQTTFLLCPSVLVYTHEMLLNVYCHLNTQTGFNEGARMQI
jgi:hypothetical protein